ncbi:MAG: ParB/RepB/Spo0J family partition protein [Shimia sp.]
MFQQPQFIRECETPLSDIHSEDRLRPITESTVVSLIASIEELGVLKDAIHLRKVGGAKARLILMAGAHRLEAARRLGWETIRARIYTASAEWARMLEIDDNLAHGEMDALELSIFLAERKAVYEKLHPETAAGVFKGNQYTRNEVSDIVSFTTSVAEKRAMSKRSIERLVRAGAWMSAEDRAAFQALEKRPTLKDLTTLGGLNADPGERGAVMERMIASGGAVGARQALAEVQGTRAPLSHKDKLRIGLDDYWARCHRGFKRAFVRKHRALIEALLAEIDAEDATATAGVADDQGGAEDAP